MSTPSLLSMAKAVAYLGDMQSAQQLLATLQKTLSSDLPLIEGAIQVKNFELLQTKWHQLKGFAPVFCADTLIEKIFETENACKKIESNELQNLALSASADLLTQLKMLQLEVTSQLTKTLQA
jgi:HPt (histidine-containing phosphotransfer) domain-containing protein